MRDDTPLDRLILIFQDYLVHDLRNTRNMTGLLREYPHLLDDPHVAATIVPDPHCYNTAMVMGYWPRLLAAYPQKSNLRTMWMLSHHIAALANEQVVAPSLDEFLALLGHYDDQLGLYHYQAGFPDEYYLGRETMRLATKMSLEAAPMVCGLHDIVLPMADLQPFFEQWGPKGVARYAWCRKESSPPMLANGQNVLKQELHQHDLAIMGLPQPADAVQLLETATLVHGDDAYAGGMALVCTLLTEEISRQQHVLPVALDWPH